MEKAWLGLPYRPISEFYKERFGDKVYKIPVTVVDDCPNRRGLKGMQTCIFCDVWGSAADASMGTKPLEEQIRTQAEKLLKKYKASQYLVYFQAYTNSFAKIDILRKHFSMALSFPQVRGLVVGTRPDCLSPSVMRLWQEFHEKSFVGVELGVQSFYNDKLEFLKRGHSREQSLAAIEKISRQTQVDIGIHLMFGMPGETDTEVIETAKICNDLPISNVKLHNLHVLTQTPLAELFRQGQFVPIEIEEYARRVQLFVEALSPRIFVHRLAAFSSRPEELIAPLWTADKMKTHQYMIDHLRKSASFQSKSLQVAAGSLEQRWQQTLLKRSVPIAREAGQRFSV